MVHDRIVKSRYTLRKPVGPLIRRLRFKLPADLDESTQLGKVMIILTQTPHHQSFTACGWMSTTAELACISVGCETSLTQLEIMLDSQSDGAFPILNSLQKLSRCYLTISEGDWTHSLDYPLRNLNIMDML
jgi:hypothetical protein